jgi:hypothetical protein
MSSDSAALPTATPATEPPEATDVRMETVRRAELDAVFGRPSAGGTEDETTWGVALSGGGIRSATFGLGVLQSLARRGLLPGFHYQSTVSGGGYIGAFVQGLLHRHGVERTVEVLSSSVTDAVGKNASADGFDPQRPIRHLREYSNYLSPRKSALSGDTMGMLGTYVRNVLLIQVQLVALLVAACLTPLVLYRLVGILSGYPRIAIWTAAALCLVAGLLVGVISTRAAFIGSGGQPSRSAKLFALAVIASLGLATLIGAVGIKGLGAPSLLLAVYTALLYFLVWLVWFFFDVIVVANRRRRDAPPGDDTRSPIEKNPTRFILASLGSALIAGLALFAAHRMLVCLDCGPGDVHAKNWYLILLGPSIVLMSIMLAGIAHVGLAGPALSDLQREIWARIGGRAARLVILGSAAIALTVYGPWLLLKLGTVSWAAVAAAAGWLATTGAGVFGAFSRRSSGAPGGVSVLEIIVRLAPPVFVVGLLMAISLAAHLLLQHVGFAGVDAWPREAVGASAAYLEYLGKYSTEATPAVFVVLGIAAGVAILFGNTIDVNEFSMNAFYRNRLVRCYLGASHVARAPEPTTNFDPGDDIDLDKVIPEAATDGVPRPLYPLVGTALNLAATRQLDWQDRKAASFCLTPGYCGYIPPPSRRQARSIGDVPAGTQQPPSNDGEKRKTLAQALTLGTATAISGAAVSPNMGYHSSPAVTFLLTVFDARLGWWLANPHHDSAPRADSTPSSLYRIVREMLGLTRDDDDFVYLSDGGHFENLGLYELVRRRCRFIVCVDAGADRARNFADLGNAVQKCRVDFGANIEIDVSALRPGPDGRSERGCAVGTVEYTNGKTGTILYLKPSLTGAEPADVAHYASAHRSFPHESTADQYFDEKQFESYRRLGEHVANTAIEPVLERALRNDENVRRGEHAGFDVGVSPLKENFLVELYHQWVTPLAGVRDNFSTHGKAMAHLFEKMRTTPALAVLDAQIYPAWTDLVPASATGATPQTRRTQLPQGDDFRACFYFCQELMQLMESVYHDLGLEQFWEHPDNRGWMNIFRYWSWSPMFRIAWGASSPTYGTRFATFCETRLDLPALDDLVGLVEPRRVAGESWPTLCARLADTGVINHVERSILGSEALGIDAAATDVSLVLLRLDWKQLLAGVEDPPRDTTFGVAVTRIVVDDKGTPRRELCLLRVQDHLRRLGLGAAFMRLLVRDHPFDSLAVPSGDYGLGGFVTPDASDDLLDQLQRLRELARQHQRATLAAGRRT